MDDSLFTLEENSQDPVAITPTRSFWNSSVTYSSPSISSLAAINTALKQEHLNPIVMSINEDFRSSPPVSSTITANSVSSSATSLENPSNQPQYTQSAATFRQNQFMQSKSPTTNSFYLFDDDDEENNANNKNMPESTPFSSITEESIGPASNNVYSNNKESSLELDLVKHKLSSLWNNVKYSNYTFNFVQNYQINA
jgi:hypothetical protein